MTQDILWIWEGLVCPAWYRVRFCPGPSSAIMSVMSSVDSPGSPGGVMVPTNVLECFITCSSEPLTILDTDENRAVAYERGLVHLEVHVEIRLRVNFRIDLDCRKSLVDSFNSLEHRIDACSRSILTLDHKP